MGLSQDIKSEIQTTAIVQFRRGEWLSPTSYHSRRKIADSLTCVVVRQEQSAETKKSTHSGERDGMQIRHTCVPQTLNLSPKEYGDKIPFFTEKIIFLEMNISYRITHRQLSLFFSILSTKKCSYFSYVCSSQRTRVNLKNTSVVTFYERVSARDNEFRRGFSEFQVNQTRTNSD